MAGLPSQHPTVSLHLADDTLTPLITSSSSRTRLNSLTSLTTSALTSQTAAQRVNMGLVERIMVEYPEDGAVVLHSYLDPRRDSASSTDSSSSSDAHYRTGSASTTSNLDEGPEPAVSRSAASGTAAAGAAGAPEDDEAAPRLVGVVVAASHDEAREARRAAARLERVGREFQKEWTAAHGPGRAK